MKWILLMIFTFISGQAFSSEVKFEKVHRLSFDTKIKETLVIMRPIKGQRLVPLYSEFRLIEGRSIAAKK